MRGGDAGADLAVVILTWNRSSMTIDAVASVIWQDHDGNIEIIVADDGAEDDTAARVLEYVSCATSTSPTITLLQKPHSGITDTIGLGLSRVGTPQVCPMGSEDPCCPQRVRQLIDSEPRLGNNALVCAR